MADSRKALEIIRNEFHAASRQGAMLFHAMFRFRGVSQIQPNNVPPNCGGPSLRGLVDGFEVAYFYRQPGTTFCKTQLTEFFRLAEAARRCIDPLALPEYPTDSGRYLRATLESSDDPRYQWLSAVYRLAWSRPGPLLRAEPSVRGNWVGSEMLYSQHLLDEGTGGITWEVCVPLSPDAFLASALAIDLLLEAAVPISRADLSNISKLAGELLRTLDELPSAMCALEEAKARGQFDGAALSSRGFVAGTPRDALEDARARLLKALAPSKNPASYQYVGGDSDITTSDLDLKLKVGLKAVFQLCADPNQWHSATDTGREEAILQLAKLRHTLELAGDSTATQQDGNELTEELGPLLTDACDRVVVVEDRSDASLLRLWMEKILAPEQWARLSHRRFCLEFKRRPTGDEVNQRLDTIQQIHPDEVNLQPRAFVLADRDYRLQEELEEEEKKLSGKDFSHRQTWHVWQRVEIENYLVCPDAIARYVVSRLHAADPDSPGAAQDETEVRALIHEAIEASRPAVRDHLLDSFGRRRRGSMLSRIVREAEQFLDREWRAEEKLAWCDAKEVVLPYLRRELKARWNLALPERDLIGSFTMEEIPDEVKATVGEIAEFLLRARWTSRADSRQAAIQPLVEALRNSSPGIREKAAESLGDKGLLAVPPLIRALGDSSREVRLASIKSLAQIVPPATQATEALAQALDDTDAEVCESAAQTLGTIGPGAHAAVSHLAKTVRQADWRLRCAAASALGKIGVAGDAVTALREALRDRSVPARDVAAQALGALGAKAAEAVGDLLASLDGDDTQVRTQAAIALGKIGIADEAVLAALVKAMQDGQVDVRRATLEGLIELGPKATPVANLLADAMRDSDEVCRKLAAQALGKLARPQMNIVDALIHGLEDRVWTIREASAQSLGELGKHAVAAAAVLEKTAMSDTNAVVRATAATAMVLVDANAQSAVQWLIESLRGDDDAARKVAAEKLGVIGPAAVPAVPALAEALADGNWWVRFAAATTLGKLGPSAAPAVCALAIAFADDYPEVGRPGRISWGDGPVYDVVRFAAAQTLGGLGKAAALALQVLKGASGYQRAVQDAAAQAVRLIEAAQE